MPIFETSTGSRFDLLLPHTEWPELQRAVAEYQFLLNERKAAGYRMGALVQEQERAIRKDLDALKKTLLEGGEDPGAKHEAKAKKEAEAAKRRYDALDLALEDAEVKLIEIVDAHRDEWLPHGRGGGGGGGLGGCRRGLVSNEGAGRAAAGRRGRRTIRGLST